MYRLHGSELSPVTLAGNVLEVDAEALRKGKVALHDGYVAEVELRPQRPLVVEAFKDCPALGRFAMRAAMRVDMRGTLVWAPVIVGVGKIEVRRGSWAWEWEGNRRGRGQGGGASGLVGAVTGRCVGPRGQRWESTGGGAGKAGEGDMGRGGASSGLMGCICFVRSGAASHVLQPVR